MQICDCLDRGPQGRRHEGLSVRVRADGEGQGVFEFVGPGSPEIELDPVEAMLVGVRAEAGPERRILR